MMPLVTAPVDTPLTADVLKQQRLPQNDHLVFLDGWRAVAAGMVFTYHMWGFSGSPTGDVKIAGLTFQTLLPIDTFSSGVDLFMLLSGLCLFLPIVRQDSLSKWDAFAFYKRRVRRILPAYNASILYAILLPIILVMLFKVIGLKAHWQPVPSATQILAHVFMLHTFSTSTICEIYGPLWSIGVEAQFYLLFPLAVFAYRKWGPRCFLPIILLSIVYQSAVEYALNGTSFWLRFVWSVNFLGRWSEFGLGMVAAWLMVKHPQVFSRLNGVLIGCLAVACYAVGTHWKDDHFTVRIAAVALSFWLVLTYSCCNKTILTRLLAARPMVFCGSITYSIYLVHQNTGWYVSELVKRIFHTDGIFHFTILMSVGAAIVLGVSYLFYLCFEKPFLPTKTNRPPARDALA